MTIPWRIDPDAALSVRSWGDEVVVHHALSNDTHRLSAAAGQLLTQLIAAESGPAIDDDRSMTPEDPEASAVLLALVELGLVIRC